MRVKPNIDDKQLYIIGERIRKIRKDNGLKNQEALAEVLDVSREAVGEWERGETLPSLQYLLKICDLYHVDLDYIRGRLDCQTHDLQHAHDLTGLSEKALAALAAWHGSDNWIYSNWPDLISRIIEDAETAGLLHNLSTYAGTSTLSKYDFDEDTPGTNEAIHDKNVAMLWYMSKTFTNIIERQFGK